MSGVDIMVDLETWGTAPGCDIRSIGAVVFDPVAGWVGGDPEQQMPGLPFDYFYVNVRCGSNFGLTQDPATVDWWSKQTCAAQNVLDIDRVFITAALERFATWWADQGGAEARFWAHGPHFDEAILGAAYRAICEEVPWHYRAPRDTRTIYDAAGGVDLPFTGTEHNALHDAKHQALCVIEAYRRLRAPVGTPKHYEVWQEPTAKGVEAFKWSPKIIATLNSAEDASEAAYLEDCDEPAPDKHEYRRIVVRSVFQ